MSGWKTFIGLSERLAFFGIMGGQLRGDPQYHCCDGPKGFRGPKLGLPLRWQTLGKLNVWSQLSVQAVWWLGFKYLATNPHWLDIIYLCINISNIFAESNPDCAVMMLMMITRQSWWFCCNDDDDCPYFLPHQKERVQEEEEAGDQRNGGQTGTPTPCVDFPTVLSRSGVLNVRNIQWNIQWIIPLVYLGQGFWMREPGKNMGGVVGFHSTGRVEEARA